MRRKIIEIDDSKCDGCGQCIEACHEGALALVDGKAKLVKHSFCDGLGACIGDCPQSALKIVERDAPDFDAQAVAHAANPPHAHAHQDQGGCPGSAMRSMAHRAPEPTASADDQPPPSRLGHWPVQLMLVPPHAPFLRGADLVVCADCVPFAVPDFHVRYLAGRAVLVGCPKLDDLAHYAEKLEAIVKVAQPRSLTVLRMVVPCCRGIAEVSLRAAKASGRSFPVEEHVVGIEGGIERIHHNLKERPAQ